MKALPLQKILLRTKGNNVNGELKDNISEIFSRTLVRLTLTITFARPNREVICKHTSQFLSVSIHVRLRSWRRLVRRCLILYCFVISLLAFGKCVHKKLQFACPVIIKIERLNFSRKLKKITLKLITGRRGIAKQLCYISEFNKKEWTR